MMINAGYCGPLTFAKYSNSHIDANVSGKLKGVVQGEYIFCLNDSNTSGGVTTVDFDKQDIDGNNIGTLQLSYLFADRGAVGEFFAHISGNNFYTSDNGRLVIVDNSGDLSEVNTAAPAYNGLDIAYDKSTQLVHALGFFNSKNRIFTYDAAASHAYLGEIDITADISTLATDGIWAENGRIFLSGQADLVSFDYDKSTNSGSNILIDSNFNFFREGFAKFGAWWLAGPNFLGGIGFQRSASRDIFSCC